MADTLRVGVVQNFDGVAVEDRDHGTDETSERSQWVKQEERQADQDCIRRLLPYCCFATTWTLTLS
jgi:hypothetical protein